MGVLPNFYPVFVLAVVALILTPGPNVALIVANSVAHGVRAGLLTVAGTLAATAVHMLFVGFGLGQALGVLGRTFEYVRWMGVVYLVIIGLRTWFAPVVDLDAVVAAPRGAATVARAAFVSLTNPKTLLFYGAFFPQFIAADRPMAPQVWTMCATFLVLAGVIDMGWAVLAARARRVLRAHGRLRNRVSGGLLMGAGLGLALARVR